MVKEVGEGVTNVKVGDRVLGNTGWGGMAEELALEAARLIKIPDAMPFDEAAAFIMTYGTSYYALKDRGHLKPGETLLVLGAAGGVGLAAVELGKAMGARVIAAASSQEKVDLAKAHGARRGRGLSAGPVRQRRPEGAGRPVQAGAAARTAPTWSMTASAATMPRRRCAPWPGKAGSW